MLAIVPVRDDLPVGAEEAVAEADGRALVVGLGSRDAAAALAPIAQELHHWEAGAYRPAAWAAALAEVVSAIDVLVLPASPDGRDLAPRLAHELERPLVCGATRIGPHHVTVVHHGGRAEMHEPIDGPVVVTFAPGSRTVVPAPGHEPAVPERLSVAAGDAFARADAALVAVLPADPTTMDLVEARRIIGGGAGLGRSPVFAKLAEIGASFGASLGATRVVTDAGWAPHARQIGTTGVEVDPDLYVAFGISGAVQHVMGLGDPDHVISVNVDGSCPMMAMADLAIVSDAVAVVDELATRLGLAPVPAPDAPAVRADQEASR